MPYFHRHPHINTILCILNDEKINILLVTLHWTCTSSPLSYYTSRPSLTEAACPPLNVPVRLPDEAALAVALDDDILALALLFGRFIDQALLQS